MAQTQQNNSGFALPAPVEGGNAQAPAAGAPAMVNTSTEVSQPASLNELGGTADTGSRDLLIGGGILLVLFIGFFFARNAYANTLVGKRVPPNKANASAWWLFVFLSSLATGVVLSAVNAAKFLTPLIMGPVALVGLVALVLMLVSGRK